ncbi:MAG TPA: STAS domain-containing protein [Gemmataceae bacterium]|nr:STAS domain-containing protein [Gemmataceae bacterium]
METNLEVVGNVAVLELLADAVDVSNADDVRSVLIELVSAHPKLVLDLNRVRFLDSTGCGAVVEANSRFRAAGGELRLCNPASEVKTVLELARLTRILSLYDTREQALAGFGA